MKPEVAILIPCMNSMPYLKVAVRCLIESTGFLFKLILIESESTDGTKEYCDEMAQKENIEVYHIKKKGLQNAINYGIKKAGKLDTYITHDDVIHFKLMNRDWLREMYETSKADKIGTVTSLRGYGISGPLYYNGLRWVGTWSMYLPRKTINEIGLFDENMRTGDDIDYAYRCMKKDKKIAFIDYWVQHHRLTSHGDVDKPEVIAKMAKYFRKKYKLE